MRCKPKRTISEPATGASRLRLRTKKVPTALADAPNEMKTIENPKTKASADREQPCRGVRVSFLQLLDADSRKHRHITGHERQHTRREERYESCNERRKDRNFHQFWYALFM